jgi:hypothetical protein
MKLPIYDLIINQDENNDAEVSFVALVDSPLSGCFFQSVSDWGMMLVEYS